MSEDDDWVTEAMGNDSLAAELLMNFCRLPPPTPPLQQLSAALRLGWRVRQRRSKPISTMATPTPTPPRVTYAKSEKERESKNQAEPETASPTTPLSWSRSTSPSGGVGGGLDGSDTSSLPARPQAPLESSRSKATAEGVATISKRSRKKKTLAEFKEEESLLLKERNTLMNEVASWRMTCEKLKAENEALKRRKIDSHLHPTTKAVPTPASEEDKNTDRNQRRHAVSNPIPLSMSLALACKDVPQSSPLNGSCKLQEELGNNTQSPFVLPDLNMPAEGD